MLGFSKHVHVHLSAWSCSRIADSYVRNQVKLTLGKLAKFTFSMISVPKVLVLTTLLVLHMGIT
jgi:hypothetical protein